MLALAPPLAHAPSDGPHAAAYDPRPLSRHQSRRHPSSSYSSAPPSSSSSASSSSSSARTSMATVTTTSAREATARPAPVPPHRSNPSSSSSSSKPRPSPTPISTRSASPPPPPPVVVQPTAQVQPEPTAPRIDIHTYDSQELLKALAALLTNMASNNDKLPSSHHHNHHVAHEHHHSHSPVLKRGPVWDELTGASRGALSTTTSCLTFHARNVPTISLESYLLRILKYCPTTNEVFLSLLVYFDRMSRLSERATGSPFVIDSFNIHRLVIAGVTVASKFFSDVFYTNSRYAKVGGLPQAELNQLELQFLLLNNFALSISPDEMQKYAEDLVFYSTGQVPSSAPAAAPLDSPSGPASTMHAAYTSGPMTPQAPLSLSSVVPTAPAAVATGPTVVASTSAADPKTPHVRPSVGSRQHSTASSTTTEDEAGNGTEGETEFGDADTNASTDDEPTIRAAHSCASSETQSLYSEDGRDEWMRDP